MCLVIQSQTRYVAPLQRKELISLFYNRLQLLNRFLQPLIHKEMGFDILTVALRATIIAMAEGLSKSGPLSTAHKQAPVQNTGSLSADSHIYTSDKNRLILSLRCMCLCVSVRHV